jgi:hypothetical protein
VRREWAGPPVCSVCVYRQGEESPLLGSLESCCEEGVGWATSMCSVCVYRQGEESPVLGSPSDLDVTDHCHGG